MQTKKGRPKKEIAPAPEIPQQKAQEPTTAESNVLKQISDELVTAGESDCIIIVGMKHTGKSSYIINEKWKDKDMIIFISPKCAKPKQFDKKTLLVNYDHFLKFDNTKLSNCALIFDDAKYYLPSNPNAKDTKNIIDLLRMSRHSNNSIRLVFHSLNDICAQFYANIDKVILFKTVDTPETKAASIPEFHKILAAFEEVQKSDDIHFNVIVDLR